MWVLTTWLKSPQLDRIFFHSRRSVLVRRKRKAMMKVVFLTLLVLAATEAGKFKKSKTSPERKPGFIEKRQTASCAANEVLCATGYRCIQNEWTCDTERDCPDGSDEVNCPADCSGEHEIKCNNNRCIPSEYRCDGENDCGDNTDELDCHKFTCPAGEVQCDNFLCIEEVWMCDGQDDCRDNYDEHNCVQGSCRADQFECADNSRCIDARWKCDGESDCHDNSDEATCECDASTEFKCRNGPCIPLTWKCDDDDDCTDSSDETGCPTLHPSLCNDMMTAHDCALMNDTNTPICLDEENGFKFCRKFCNLCVTGSSG